MDIILIYFSSLISFHQNKSKINFKANTAQRKIIERNKWYKCKYTYKEKLPPFPIYIEYTVYIGATNTLSFNKRRNATLSYKSFIIKYIEFWHYRYLLIIYHSLSYFDNQKFYNFSFNVGVWRKRLASCSIISLIYS